MRDEEKHVILEFCKKASEILGDDVRVIAWPEEETPGRSRCDAIVSWAGVQSYLEHTSIDAYERQREDDARFSRVLSGKVRRAVETAFPQDRISIGIPSHAIPTRVSWNDLTNTIAFELVQALKGLPRSEKAQQLNLPSVPFPVTVWKNEPATVPACVIGRFAPTDPEGALAEVMLRTVEDKCRQVERRGLVERPSILLIEYSDLAMLREDLVAQALRSVARNTKGNMFDYIYLADNSWPPVRFFPAKLRRRMYPDICEFQEWREAQRYSHS